MPSNNPVRVVFVVKNPSTKPVPVFAIELNSTPPHFLDGMWLSTWFLLKAWHARISVIALR